MITVDQRKRADELDAIQQGQISYQLIFDECSDRLWSHLRIQLDVLCFFGELEFEESELRRMLLLTFYDAIHQYLIIRIEFTRLYIWKGTFFRVPRSTLAVWFSFGVRYLHRWPTTKILERFRLQLRNPADPVEYGHFLSCFNIFPLQIHFDDLVCHRQLSEWWRVSDIIVICYLITPTEINIFEGRISKFPEVSDGSQLIFACIKDDWPTSKVFRIGRHTLLSPSTDTRAFCLMSISRSWLKVISEMTFTKSDPFEAGYVEIY